MIRLPIGNVMEFLQIYQIHFTVGGLFLNFTMERVRHATSGPSAS